MRGADPREIDWNLYGRLGQLFVKRFEGETEVDIDVVLDRSGSMGVARGEKDRTSRLLAAAALFAWAGDGRGVRVHLLDDRLMSLGPRVRGEAERGRVLSLLEEAPEPRGGLAPEGIGSLLRAGKSARVVVLISDFLDEPPWIAAVAGNRSPRVELVLAGVTSRSERDPAEDAALRLEDVESGEHLDLVVDAEMRSRYLRLFDAARRDLAAQAAAHGAHFVDLSSEVAFDELFHKVAARVSG